MMPNDFMSEGLILGGSWFVEIPEKKIPKPKITASITMMSGRLRLFSIPSLPSEGGLIRYPGHGPLKP